MIQRTRPPSLGVITVVPSPTPDNPARVTALNVPGVSPTQPGQPGPMNFLNQAQADAYIQGLNVSIATDNAAGIAWISAPLDLAILSNDAVCQGLVEGRYSTNQVPEATGYNCWTNWAPSHPAVHVLTPAQLAPALAVQRSITPTTPVYQSQDIANPDGTTIAAWTPPTLPASGPVALTPTTPAAGTPGTPGTDATTDLTYPIAAAAAADGTQIVGGSIIDQIISALPASLQSYATAAANWPTWVWVAAGAAGFYLLEQHKGKR